MRDLRSPVFLHVDGGRILINLIVWLGERKTRRAVMVCCSKNRIVLALYFILKTIEKIEINVKINQF